MEVPKHLNQIAGLIKQFKFNEAETKLLDLLGNGNGDNQTGVYFLLGKVYQQKQEYGKALNYYHKTLEIDASHAEAKVGITIIQSILQITNNYFYENPYTDDELYH